MADKDYLGINFATSTPYAFVGRLKWNLRKDGVTQKVNDKLLSIHDEYLKKIRLIKSEKETVAYQRKVANEILTLLLDKFTWNKPANDPQCGPALLVELSAEVKDFCTEGGAEGRRRSQMRLNLARQLSRNISRT